MCVEICTVLSRLPRDWPSVSMAFVSGSIGCVWLGLGLDWSSVVKDYSGTHLRTTKYTSVRFPPVRFTSVRFGGDPAMA